MLMRRIMSYTVEIKRQRDKSLTTGDSRYTSVRSPRFRISANLFQYHEAADKF
jgi:hypothetical protein